MLLLALRIRGRLGLVADAKDWPGRDKGGMPDIGLLPRGMAADCGDGSVDWGVVRPPKAPDMACSRFKAATSDAKLRSRDSMSLNEDWMNDH